MIKQWQTMSSSRKILITWISILVIIPLLIWVFYRWDFALAIFGAILTPGIYYLRRTDEDNRLAKI